VYVTTAERPPATFGSNSIEFVQLAPAGNGFGHVEADLINELAPLPVIVVEAVKLTGDPLVFLIVTICAAVVVPTAVEAKLSDVGVNVSVGPEDAPVPDSATVCGDPAAVSVYVTTALSAPALAGSNSIEFVQLAPAGRGFVQVEADLINELAPLPVIVVEAVKLTADALVFLIVTICAAVVVPTAVDAKLSDVGVIVSAPPAALTVTFFAALTAVRKLLSPAYTAVMESVPIGSEVVFSTAIPDASDPLPMFAPLFWNTIVSAFVLRLPEL
jgi:hypothetical protein